LAQVSYWIHWIPEIYFLRMKKDEIPAKVITAGVFVGVIVFSYLTYLHRITTVLLVLHFIPEVFLSFAKLTKFAEKEVLATWLFRVGNVIFIAARFLSVIFTVLTFWFGLEPYASQVLRHFGLTLVGGLQSYLLFQFAIFQARRLKSVSSTPASSVPKSPKKVKKTPKELSDLPEVDQNTRKQALNKKVKTK